MIKIIVKLKTIVITKVNAEVFAHSICNLKYIVPKEILVVFHNKLNYDYHFITKELTKRV